MSNCMTEVWYEFKRAEHIRKKAGLTCLDNMSDSDVLITYEIELGKSHDKLDGVVFEFNDGGSEFAISSVGELFVHSEIKPEHNRDTEIMRHHLGVIRYRKYLQEQHD